MLCFHGNCCFGIAISQLFLLLILSNLSPSSSPSVRSVICYSYLSSSIRSCHIIPLPQVLHECQEAKLTFYLCTYSPSPLVLEGRFPGDRERGSHSVGLRSPVVVALPPSGLPWKSSSASEAAACPGCHQAGRGDTGTAPGEIH